MCCSLWKLHTNKFYSQRTIDFYTIGHRSIKEENSSKSAFQKNSTKQGTWNTKPFEISMTYVFFAKNFLDSKKKRFSKWTPSRYLKEQTSCLKFILKCHQKRTKSKPITSLCKVFKWENQYFFTKPFDICVLLCCCSIFCPFTGPPDILLQPGGLIEYKGKFQNSIFTILVFKNSSR